MSYLVVFVLGCVVGWFSKKDKRERVRSYCPDEAAQTGEEQDD